MIGRTFSFCSSVKARTVVICFKRPLVLSVSASLGLASSARAGCDNAIRTVNSNAVIAAVELFFIVLVSLQAKPGKHRTPFRQPIQQANKLINKQTVH